MSSHLIASIPGQGLVELLRQSPSILDQCIHHCLGVLSIHFHQHHIAAVALNQRGDLTIFATAQQIAFPVSWYCTIFDDGRPLAYGSRIADTAMVTGFLGVMTW